MVKLGARARRLLVKALREVLEGFVEDDTQRKIADTLFDKILGHWEDEKFKAYIIPYVEALVNAITEYSNAEGGESHG